MPDFRPRCGFLRHLRRFAIAASEDFDARLTRQLGLTVRRYMTICLGLHVRFMTWDPKNNRFRYEGWYASVGVVAL